MSAPLKAQVTTTATTAAQDDLDFHQRAAAEVQTERNFASAVLDTVSALVVVLDTEGRIVRFNRACEQATGYASKEVLGERFWDLFLAPEEAPAAIETFGRLKASQFPVRHENDWIAKDGVRRRIAWANTCLVDATGQVSFVIGTGVDITEHKRAEEALRQSEGHFRALAETLPQIVWTADAQGGIEWFNRRWYEYTGEPQGVGEGWSWDKVAHPDDMAHTLAKWQDALQKGAFFQNEIRLRSHDGRYHWFLVRAWPLTDDGGEVVRWFGTDTDIEDLKRIERLYAVLSRANEAIVRIHDEHALYDEVCRIIAESGQFPLVWIGLVKGGEVLPVAASGPAADYLGEIKVKMEGELGMGPTGKCIREDLPMVNDDFNSNPAMTPWREPALRRGFRASAAFPLRRREAVIGALTLYAARPGAFDPEHVGLLESLSADLSYALDAMQQEGLRKAAELALRENERSLREADQRKNEFLAVLSHELRNPLTPIKNSLYILDRAVPGSAQAERAKAVIGRQVEQLSRLVDDLLDVTRIARNKIHLHRQSVDLNHLVERALDDHRSVFENNMVELELELAPVPPLVHGDPTRLTQVVGNLLQNAAKFTPRGGRTRLSVSADSRDTKAVIRVADTGVGMTPETLSRVFEPFMQADKTLDRSKGGLGLGLALVKGLIELHGGEITAHSAGLGLGAEFVVRLPLDSIEASAQVDRAGDS